MIDAKSLRIGNWIESGITGGLFQCSAADILNIAQGLDEEKTSPIPLSPSVLEGLGFYRFNKPWVPADYDPEDYNRWRFTIWDDDNGDYYYNSAEFQTPLQFVHQVQNLHFALTGQELIYNPQTK